MKKIRPLLFTCMLVFLSLSLTACAGRKSGNMNETSNNRATSSAAAETGTGAGGGTEIETGENGMTGDTASGWEERENGTLTGGTNGETETTGKGLIDDLTDDLSRGASDAAGALEGR